MSESKKRLEVMSNWYAAETGMSVVFDERRVRPRLKSIAELTLVNSAPRSRLILAF
jgi:hypothetical protein